MTQESATDGTRNVTNGLLFPSHNNMNSHIRSSSVASLARSTTSHMTRVSDEPELVKEFGPRLGRTYSRTINHTKKYSWLDHLAGVFCIHREGKVVTIVETTPVELDDSDDVETPSGKSPWVQPVFVLSTRKDTDKNEVPKRAKCTIDTGNMQGNIVSEDFVINVLGYSKHNFKKLTKEEEKGGTAINGHKFFAKGAIYLTWWHNKSQRVFHDMRFLVAESEMCDLVIGAASIQKNHILDVPNFMIGKTFVKGRVDNEEATLEAEQHRLDEIRREAKKKLENAEEEEPAAGRIKELKTIFDAAEKKHKISTAILEHYKAKRDGNKELEAKYQKDIDDLIGIENLPNRSTTGASGMLQHNKVNGEAKKRTLSDKLSFKK